MLNKLIVGILGLVVVVAGIAAFSAFTAQLINLEAHIEKEIELAAVTDCVTDTATGDIVCKAGDGNYGTVIPQELYDKTVELTLSRSFFDQDRFYDVRFDVLWECKQYVPARDVNQDGFDDCRPIHDPTAAGSDPDHANEELDGSLRDYVQSIVTAPNCINAPQGQNPSRLPEEKDVELIGSGVIDKDHKKCFFAIKLLAPPCADSFNAATDPLGPDVQTVNCHFIKPTSDPQTWEHYADIGDEFKIQVTAHSVPACNGVTDTCIDADGTFSKGRGLITHSEVTLGDALTSWPTGGYPEGIDWFDQDSTCSWTLGDDLHVEDPNRYPTAIRDGLHQDNANNLDPVVLDLNGDLLAGRGVDVDLETGTVNPNSHSNSQCAGVPPKLKFHDTNGNGFWDNGEDIVLDGNSDGIFN